MLLAGGGMLIAPALVNAAGATEVPLLHLRISAADEALVSALAEAVIPTTDTPGAKALNLHQFVLKMMDDCAAPGDQQRFQNGLALFEPFAQKQSSLAFASNAAPQQVQLLRTIRDSKDAPADLRFFVDQVRRLTIRGYETSEYVLTKVHPYELVPGRFNGCKKIGNV